MRSAEKLEEVLGRAAWGAYREAVGGVAWNGDALPEWERMLGDDRYKAVVRAWKLAALEAVTAFLEIGLAPTGLGEEEGTEGTEGTEGEDGTTVDRQ